MESWNVIACDDPEGDFVLMNKTKTLIRFSQRHQPDVVKLMSQMEEAGVPFSFTEDVKEIYFTYLKDCTHGDYTDGTIRMSCGHESREMFDRTLVHELAHHLDEVEDISDRVGLLEEKKKKARYLPDRYARKNIGEYIAIGFEVYYFGTRKERQRMRKCNPRLWNVIKYLHRKYRTR